MPKIHLTIRVDRETINRLDTTAQASGVKRTDVIRSLLNDSQVQKKAS
jgi:predicted transcriptional regulator